MKSSNGFNARRLRPPTARRWGARVGILISLILMLGGIAGLCTAVAGAFGLAAAAELGTQPAALAALAAVSLVVFYLGLRVWRRIRRRRLGGLDLAPHLMKR